MKRILVLIFILLATQAWGATYTPTSDETMQTAIAALVNGDTLTISGSWTSTVRYTISATVTINSSSASNKITLGTDDNYAFYLSGNNTTCSGFQIDCDKANRTTGTGIILVGDTITVSSMTILNGFNYGILVAATSQGNTISGCTITNVGGAGITKSTYGNCIRFNSGGTGTVTGCTLSNDSSGSDIVFVNASAGVTITGNTISGGDAGIHMYGASNSAVITNNTISDIGIAVGSEGADIIAISGTNSTVSGNVGTQNVEPVDVVAAYETMGGSTACDGSTISYNRFSGTYLGIGLLGGGSTITVNGNSISSINGSIQQNCTGSTFTNNYFVCSSASPTYGGLRLDSNAEGTRNATVYNNTFVGAGGNGLTWFETSGIWGATSAATNNIFTGWAKGVVVYDKDNDGITVAHTYNDYYSNTANVQKFVSPTYSNESLGTGEITTEPLLTGYVLANTSPCKNAGTTVGVTTDIRGLPRLGTPDIGAFELGHSSTAGGSFSIH